MIRKTINYVFIIGIIVSVVILSYTFSQQFYSFYLKTLFHYVYKDDFSKQIEKAELLYKQKEYEKMLKIINQVSMINSDIFEINKIASDYYFEIDDEVNGIKYYLKAYENKNTSLNQISEILPLMYKHGYYGDIVALLGDFDLSRSDEYSFYLGASLSEVGKYDEALEYLNISAKNGNFDDDLYFYYARTYYNQYEKNKKKSLLTSAESNIKKSVRVNNKEKRYIELYLKIANAQGKYKEAERALRQMQE